MKKQLSRIITGLLVISLMSITLKAADTSVTKNDQPKARPNLVFECVAITIVVGVITYAVYRCVKAAGLTNPPPPPSNPSTNSSNSQIVFTPMDVPTTPRVIEHHALPAIVFTPMDVPTPPGSTNVDGGTNTYTSGLVSGSSLVNFNVVLATNNDAGMEVKQDISTNGWTDWQGNTYTWLLITQTDPSGPHIQTSTNLVTWTDANYSVNIWASSSVSPDPNMAYLTNVVTVLYDGNGIPLVTNWSSILPNAPINVGIPATAPEMFFRGVTP